MAKRPGYDDRYGAGDLAREEYCWDPDLYGFGLGLSERESHRDEVTPHLSVVGEERRERKGRGNVACGYLLPDENTGNLSHDRPRTKDRGEERQSHDQRENDQTR